MRPGRLERLVSDLLDMARIEGHALTLNAVDIDLGEALSAAAARLRRASPDAPWTQTPPGRPRGPGGLGRGWRVLDNLLRNADRHAPPGTPIALEAAPGKRSMVVTRVVDQGPGVAAELRERIFERFVRGPDAGAGNGDQAPTVGGTGLGLAIVRGLVEAHAGRVWVEDPAAGEGGCFAFTLPAA